MIQRPFQLFDSLEPIIFDGNVALCYVIDMHSNVTNAKVRNVAPGAKYTIVLHQDAVGGRKFAWPTQCVNAEPICLEPGATTVQNFIGMPGGTMQANLPGAWIGATP